MSEELIVRKPSNVESLEKELEELKAAQTKPVDKEESETPPVKKEESVEPDEPKTGWEKRYTVEFPEFWLAMKYVEALQDNEDIIKIYLLERISDGSFDITRKFK